MNIDYHIEYDKRYYSVHHLRIHQRVEVRATATIVTLRDSEHKRVRCRKAESNCAAQRREITEAAIAAFCIKRLLALPRRVVAQVRSFFSTAIRRSASAGVATASSRYTRPWAS